MRESLIDLLHLEKEEKRQRSSCLEVGILSHELSQHVIGKTARTITVNIRYFKSEKKRLQILLKVEKII